MSKSAIAGILIVVALLIGAGAYASMRDSDVVMDRGVMTTPSVTATPSGIQATPTVTTTPVGTATPSPTKAADYSMAEVATHNSRENCWAAVNGNVYDLSAWIAQHPGGPAAIAKLCGTDGSAQFNKQHGSQAQANTALAQFKIGALK
ncbi:MAG: cytochrome b5 domain-containing protein [Candidatus Doudnabacteria bacterium]|nr:cytochrome b5 domain-containing protein [Candidatus Doudnabacteria bacterium]